jgi:hypothetical protein
MSTIFRKAWKEFGNIEFIGSLGRVSPDPQSVITCLSVAESLRPKKFTHELEMAKQSCSGLNPEPDKVDYENHPHKRDSSDGFF